MRLISFDYSEHMGHEYEWVLNGLTLAPLNLIVGKNATGKSRTISIINSLANLLSGRKKEVYNSGNYHVVFQEETKKIEYHLEYVNFEVLKEDLIVDGQNMMHRGQGGLGQIQAEDVDGKSVRMKFKAPSKEIAVASKRDPVQHSFLEYLHDWGSAVRHFAFGGDMAPGNLAIAIKGPERDIDEKNTSYVVPVFNHGVKRFPDTFTKTIIADMSRIGYSIEELSIRRPPHTITHELMPGELVGIAAKEQGLRWPTYQPFMSQGMFRCLSLIIQANYYAMSKREGCILVDDIGEGLDYERSCKLIEVIRNKAKEGSFQLIMSTNDRFVMNSVPLEEWCYLIREGNHMHVLNYLNSKDAFERFKITGLNNFDLLTTHYLEKITGHG